MVKMKILSYIEFITERANPNTIGSDLVLEGGAAGHMAHPFDDKSLTFGDFKKMVEAGLSGELNFEEDPTEKTDGQNIFATVKDGVTMFARNAGQLRNPIDLRGITDMFAAHPSESVRQTFTLAANDLASALSRLKPAQQEAIFNNGTSFMNMELIYSGNSNVINYDRDVIQFHGVKHTDGNGNIIGEDSRPARELAKILNDINAHIGKVFTIIPPQALMLRRHQDFSAKLPYFMNKIEALRSRYGLSDSDEVSRYHEMWWREEIDKSFPNLPQDVKEALLQRWAYNNKGAMDFRTMGKMIETLDMNKVKQYDKMDAGKKYKENIRPFEDLFLELGSEVLKNASNFLAASPDKEMQRLHNQIRTEADKIRLNGDEKQIAKVEAELDRLARIGGIESIIPSEGLVFKYNGKIYKLTGTFAAINQLMGIIKYGR
jgi:hypothetical protein